MSRPVVRFALLVLGAQVVQQAVFSQTAILGVHLNALLTVVLCIAIAGGSQRGAIVGFSAGLLHDVFLTTPLGASALAYAIAGYVVGVISDGADELLWVSAALAALGSVVAVGTYLIVGARVAQLVVSFGDLTKAAVVIAVVNALVVPLIARRFRIREPIRREVVW